MVHHVLDSDDEDADQIAANEVMGSKYPLAAHRCLGQDKFKSVNQVESVHAACLA